MPFVSQGQLLTRRCQACGSEVSRFASQFSNGVYCSRNCYASSKRGQEPHNKGKKVFGAKACSQCGIDMIGAPALVKRRKFCSPKCFGQYYSGERAPAWNGGHSKDGRREFGSQGYKHWKLSVLSRDGGKCRWCDSDGIKTYRNLEVHHIIPFASHPDGALDLSNGITLCKDHHTSTFGREDVYAKFLSDLIGGTLRTEPSASRPSKKALNITAAELNRLYWEERLSANAIGANLGVTGACILKHMKRHGIARQLKRRWYVNAN